MIRAGRRLAGVVVMTMVIGLLVAPGTARAEAPARPLALTPLAADTSLSALQVVANNSGSQLGPQVFSPKIHYYQLINWSGSTTLKPVATDSAATIAVTLNGTPQTVASNGQVALSLSRGRNEAAITVTGSDASTGRTTWRSGSEPRPRRGSSA